MVWGAAGKGLVPKVLMGAGVYVGGVFIAMQSMRAGKEKMHAADSAKRDLKPVTTKARLDAFDSNAKKYDSEIDWNEISMGLPLIRRWLLGYAQGNVLEVATGTGRNFKYYGSDCTLTACDASEPMLDQAKLKAGKKKVDFKLVEGENLSKTFGENSFDTVVDTFGLCSFENPAKALEEMARVCKPGGRVLLLEHGRSGSYEFLNRRMDKNASKHARKWGCWYNRDIECLVRNSPLEIESIHRFHFGTTYYIVARV